MTVQILKCPYFNETAKMNGLMAGTSLFKSYTEFIRTKVTNPIAPYGASDKSNPPTSPLALEIPKIRHAHLTSDISIFYTIAGKNPTQLKLYAILTHSQVGSGQPSNPKKQIGIGKKLANQAFECKK